MEEFKCVRVIDLEKAEAVPVSPPPKYLPSTLAQSQQESSHILKSLLTSLLCCAPTRPLGTFFNAKDHCAIKGGDNESAKKYSRWAKNFVMMVMVLGIAFCMTSFYYRASAFAVHLSQAKISFRDGLLNGISEGKMDGTDYALAHLASNSGNSVTLPNPVPAKVNVFDVRQDNPFWVKVRAAMENGQVYKVAKMFGEQFGWAHGFKVGFCIVEGTDCKGVELRQSRCPFMAVFGGSLRNHAHHGGWSVRVG